jgi:archaeosine-15-forming tRNA-guanine transglycosylase
VVTSGLVDRADYRYYGTVSLVSLETIMTRMQIAYGKALIKKMVKNNRKVKPSKSPRYDEVFFKGVEWLDKQ